MTATPSIGFRGRAALATASLVAMLGGIFAAANAQGPESAPFPPIAISPTAPSDIPGGAPNADLAAAAAFAWREFIALNWPAQPGVRDTADTSLPFGQNAAAGGPPLVWETLRHKIEMFPPRDPSNTSAPLPAPHGSDAGPPHYGYDAPPAYYYVPADVGSSDGGIAACPGQAPVAQAAWVNLDETSQIGLDQMYAGVLPANSSGPNSSPRLIRFMAKANRTEYLYVMQHDYWYHSVGLTQAEQNFQNAVAKHEPPLQPIVFFPPGSIEIKSAWRPLAPGEDASRYHTAMVRFYETNNKLPCYVEAQWALLALHIIQKTPSAPAFVFATFEQADNILTEDGKPVEDADGRIINPQREPATEPGLTFEDSPTDPQVSLLIGAKYCTDIGKRLFYHEIGGNAALPAGGDICVKQRYHPIPKIIADVNAAAHDAIATYDAANKVQNSPWRYYKLVNVQAFPFDRMQIDPKTPNGPHNAATFFQANSVVETDYTLQNFNGRLSGGAPTEYPAGNSGSDFKNTHLFLSTPPAMHAFNMGGCQGCHANAQLGGTDFSFILDGNMFQTTPDAPGPATAAAAAAKYKQRFLRLE